MPVIRHLRPCTPLVALWLASLFSLSGCQKPSGEGERAKVPAPPSAGPVRPAARRSSARASRPAARRDALPRTVAAPGSGRVAGTKDLFFAWSKEAFAKLKEARGRLKRKDPAGALPLLDAALVLQPENLSIRYWRACTRALAGKPALALDDLEVLLYAHFPKYNAKLEREPELAGLRAPPHAARLAALRKAAEAAHHTAAVKALLFLGGARRAARRGDRLVGDQEIVGYLPDSGRYVAITWAEDGVVLGFVPYSEHWLLYLSATAYAPGETLPALKDARLHISSRTSGSPIATLLSHLEYESYEPKNTQAQPDRGPLLKGTAPEEHAVFDVYAEVHPKSAIQYLYGVRKPDGTRGHGAGGLLTWDQIAGKWDPHDEPAKAAERPDERLVFRPCGGEAKADWGRPRRDKEVITLGGKPVTVPCAGLVWTSPESTYGAYQPYPYCQQKAGLRGLYLLDRAGTPKLLFAEKRVLALRWQSDRELFAQVGHRLLYANAPKAAAHLLAAPEAFLNAYAPYLSKCDDPKEPTK